MRYAMFVIVMGLVVVILAAASVKADMKPREKTEMIVVHHTGADHGCVSSIRAGHIQDRGWSDIGYHFLICNGDSGGNNPPVADGQIQEGRALHLKGAHARTGWSSDRNPSSVGVSLVGTDSFTALQKQRLTLLLADLCERYRLTPSPETIQGHKETCPGPGLDLGQVRERVRAELQRRENKRRQERNEQRQNASLVPASTTEEPAEALTPKEKQEDESATDIAAAVFVGFFFGFPLLLNVLCNSKEKG